MNEQTSINPALWRQVATELERIAGAEWPHQLWHSVSQMPEGPQRDALALCSYGMVRDSPPAEEARDRWLLLACATQLRAEADGAEGMLCRWCDKPLLPNAPLCRFCGHGKEADRAQQAKTVTSTGSYTVPATSMAGAKRCSHCGLWMIPTQGFCGVCGTTA